MLISTLGVVLASPAASANPARAEPAAVADPPAARQRSGAAPDIRVVGGGWGRARVQDIEAVLQSVAAILLEHFPGRRLYPIVVSHGADRPLTLYRKSRDETYQVRLSATDAQWTRYAYEFAHELSHILTNYDHQVDVQAARFNGWFEEALCEAASLYVLKRLAFEWEVRPPHPGWRAYAPRFQQYVERFLYESHRRLPPEVTLAIWFDQHEQALRGSPHLRNHNEVVANLLLPLFEENAEFWEAIGYLNVDRSGGDSFREYLQRWHDNAPEDYRDTIRYIMALFGVLKAGE